MSLEAVHGTDRGPVGTVAPATSSLFGQSDATLTMMSTSTYWHDKVHQNLPENLAEVDCQFPPALDAASARGRIGLVVPTYKRPEVLRECLESLARSDLKSAVVCIVDESATEKLVEFSGYVRLVGLEQFGHNLGQVEGSLEQIKEACDDRPDCVAFSSNGWLKHAVDELSPVNYFDFACYVKEGYFRTNVRATPAQPRAPAGHEALEVLKGFRPEDVPLIKLFKRRHSHMFNSLRMGWDLLVSVFDCQYLCCLDSDTVVQPAWLTTLRECYDRNTADAERQGLIVSGFNSSTSMVVEKRRDSCLKKQVGGINLLFSKGLYESTVRAVLTDLSWDNRLSEKIIQSRGKLLCTRPSVVDHLGTQGVWSDGSTFDFARDRHPVAALLQELRAMKSRLISLLSGLTR